MPPFSDIGALPEDEQIRILAGDVMKGLEIAFFVEDDTKADRYLKKLGGAVRVLYRGPVPGNAGICVKIAKAYN